jgi:hypothetical protein
VSDSFTDLVGKGLNIDEIMAIAGKRAGDRTSLGRYDDVAKQRSQYHEDQYKFKDSEMGTIRERVQRESPVIAELRTNVIVCHCGSSCT